MIYYHNCQHAPQSLLYFTNSEEELFNCSCSRAPASKQHDPENTSRDHSTVQISACFVLKKILAGTAGGGGWEKKKKKKKKENPMLDRLAQPNKMQMMMTMI